MPSVKISTAFDSGSIVPVRLDDPGDIALRLRDDQVSDPAVQVRQWFHFRVQGARDRALRLRILNAAEATFPGGWPDYRACASYDHATWFRVPTRYEDGVLVIEHTPERDSVYYAYFEPYSWERHLQLLGRAEASPLARVRDLGATVDGRDINVVDVSAGGSGPRRQCWIIARQHPGESMAEWLAEGLLARLLDPGDALGRTLLAQADFHVVPNMNPDGSVRGNLRVNAAGANLNREWVSPSAARSPEVLAVRADLERTGCDFFIDAHGDETIPYVFCAGNEMLPGTTAAQKDEQARYLQALLAASPEFQVRHGYPAAKYSEDALKLASKWVGHRFGCVSLTLEMPFKDNFDRPDAQTGWSGARSAKLGGELLAAMGAFWGGR